MPRPRNTSRLTWTVTVRHAGDTGGNRATPLLVHPAADLWQAIVLAAVVRQFWPALRTSIARHWSPNVTATGPAGTPASDCGPLTLSAPALNHRAPGALTAAHGERSVSAAPATGWPFVSAQALTANRDLATAAWSPVDSNTERRALGARV